MEDPSCAPTAADYAQAEARDANERLKRIEAALIKAGIMEPPPPPVPRMGAWEALREIYDRKLAEVLK